jgi:hypothetical protein
MPYKVFVAGEEALAADANSYLMSQTVPRFTNASQRTSQLTAPVLNQLSMRDDRPGAIERWSGSAWVDLVTKSELQYTERTANLSITSTTETSADAVVQGASMAFDGNPVLLEGFLPAVVPPAVAGAILHIWLYQDGLSIGRLGAVGNPAGAQMIAPVFAARRMTPSAGSHNYTIGATVSGSTGTVGAGPGGLGQYLPAYLRISRA